VNDDITSKSLLSEMWREYEMGNPGSRVIYRIDEPVTLFLRSGGTTHRVLDSEGVVHCIPAPGFNNCILRWKSKPGEAACNF
jgi:hypothetical protein